VVMWLFTVERRVTLAEKRSLEPRTRGCVACGGDLLRMAEREVEPPYHWQPRGFICGACNSIMFELPS
jgi:uncharacterized protein with PIN domain